MFKRLFLLTTTSLLFTVAFAAASGPASRMVTDMAGRTVTVPLPVQRLITTFKPASLCVTALGLQHRLVGIDTDSRRDRLQVAVTPSIAGLPAVGQKSSGLNFEAIISLQPDLVILYAQKDGIVLADRLVDHGVPAIVIVPETMQSLYDTLNLIAAAAGVPQRAEKAVGTCRRVVASTRQRVSRIKAGQRKVVYFASPLGLFSTATGDLLQNEMITAAGAVNAGRSLKGYFREISPEQFIAWNPDVIVLSVHGHHRGYKTLRQPQFAAVSAVAANRIYTFPSNIAPWDFPSPLSALGVLWLAAKCYPEQFADLDLDAEIEKFHVDLFEKGFAELGGKPVR